jgi:hypothetical protein
MNEIEKLIALSRPQRHQDQRQSSLRKDHNRYTTVYIPSREKQSRENTKP